MRILFPLPKRGRLSSSVSNEVCSYAPKETPQCTFRNIIRDMTVTITAMNILSLDEWAAKDFSRKTNCHYSVLMVKTPSFANASLDKICSQTESSVCVYMCVFVYLRLHMHIL